MSVSWAGFSGNLYFAVNPGDQKEIHKFAQKAESFRRKRQENRLSKR
jgi:hypothetical protein